MSMEKLFICLANSKKFTDRCIAGIELVRSSREGYKYDIVRTEDNSPKWIRPVSADQGGAVPATLVDHVDLLDIVKINVTALTPEGYQSDNVLFDNNRLNVIDNIQGTPSLIGQLLSVNMPVLFGNRGSAVSIENITQLDHSLVLIEPENVEMGQTVSESGKPQIRTKFVFNDNSYDLPITDIDFTNRFSNNSTLLESCTNIYFAISLGVEFNGWYYKLIAGVVYF